MAATQQVEATPESDDRTAAGQTCYLGVVLARDAVVVASETTGQLEDIRVRVGDQVTKDQLLATLDTRATRHQLDMEKASLRNAEAEKRRNDLAVLQAEEEEKRRIRLKDLISEEEIASAKFQRQQAEAQRDAAAAAISRVQASIEQLDLVLESSRIKAPFGGTVAQRYLDAGTLVNQGTPIVRLISDGGLLARFAMPPEEAREVQIGSRIRIVIEDLGTTLAGVVEHLAPEIDSASQMLFAEASVEADDSIRVPSGAMARVVVVDETLIGDEEPAIVNCS